MYSEASTTGIHCKVGCNGQYRRFLFNGTEFAALYRQVGTLLGLPAEKEFVLKYQDDEGDMITIETDEELACAVGYGKDPTLLRLFVSVASSKEEPATEKVVECDFSDGEEKGRKWKCKRGGRGKHMHPYSRDDADHGHERGYGRHGHHHEKKWWKEDNCRDDKGDENCKGKWKEEKKCKRKQCDKQGKRLAILRKKKERLESMLQFLEKISPEEGNYKLREKRISHIKEKLTYVDQMLKDLPQSAATATRRELTEEERKQVYLLRERITTIKFIIHETKAQACQKKRAMREVEDAEAKATCEAELTEMKGTIWDLKKQVRDLKEQIFSICHSPSVDSPIPPIPTNATTATTTTNVDSPVSIRDINMTGM